MHRIMKSSLFGLGAAATVASATATSQAATVAYYTFEEGTADTTVFAGGNSLVDSAGGDDNMRTWADYTTPIYSNVAAPNSAVSLRFPGDANSNTFAYKDAYTQGGPVETTAFTAFTIEAWVNFDTTTGGNKTFIGRDDDGSDTSSASLFYFQSSGGKFKIEFVDAATPLGGTKVAAAVTGTTSIETSTWYHIAAVGDGSMVTLYVDGVAEGSTSYTGLFNPPVAANTPWIFGRGEWANSPTDEFKGYLDDVRFSDTALSPSEFLLNAGVPEPASMALLAMGLGLIAARRRRA